MFTKICKYCGKEFSSEVRNTRYCSSECCDKAQVQRKKHNKVKARKRKEYSENKEINRALTKAYSLCSTVSELFQIPQVCNCKAHGFTTECSGPLERNHINLNPFDNSPWNIEMLCKHHHKMFHDMQGDVNMVDTYNESVDNAGFEDDDKKHLSMINYVRSKIEDAQNL